jgi:phenylalanyl-tRNA synthetase alpha subunit
MSQRVIKKNIATVTQEESDELQRIVSEKQAVQEVLNDTINHCRALVAKSVRESSKWWNDMSKKYNFDVESQCGFSSQDNTIYRLVDEMEELEQIANSEPETIQ